MNITTMNLEQKRILIAGSGTELAVPERGSEQKPFRMSFTQQLNDAYESTILLQGSGNELVFLIALVPLQSFDAVVGERLLAVLDSEETEIYTNESGDAEFVCPMGFSDLRISWPTQDNFLLLTCQNITYSEDAFVPVYILHSAENVMQLVIQEPALQISFDGTIEGFTLALSKLMDEEVGDERGKTCSARELMKRLKKKGVAVVPNKGRHPYKAMLTDGRTVPIPFHNGDLPTGTFRAILGQLGISYEELMTKN